MTKLALVVVMVLGGCAGTFGSAQHGSRRVQVANAVSGGLAIVATALDLCQTHTVAADGWPQGRTDEGMVGMTLGPRPSSYAVDAYFVATSAILVGLTQSVPERYRWAGHLAVAGVGFYAAGTSMWGGARTHCGPLGG